MGHLSSLANAVGRTSMLETHALQLDVARPLVVHKHIVYYRSGLLLLSQMQPLDRSRCSGSLYLRICLLILLCQAFGLVVHSLMY